jgi:hypothetical protein
LLSGASRDTDNLTRVVDALSVRTRGTRYINGEKATVSEKKTVKYPSAIGERTDNIAVIVDAKRSSQDGARDPSSPVVFRKCPTI